jgi:hypothetical protein
MGVQINLHGRGDYARTVESVSKQPANRDGAPDYQDIRNYVFSGAERGVLRVKYGNHNRDLELGTKGLFASGERHDLTTRVLRQVVERQYGVRAANDFHALIQTSTNRGDVYHLDKRSVRRALEQIEKQYASQSNAPTHPEVFNVPAEGTESAVKEISKTWSAAGPRTAPSGDFFPAQVTADLNRSNITLEGGRAIIRSGRGDAADREDYLEEQKEKLLTFFEHGSSVSRGEPQFQDMFRNFVRNIQQNFELTLNEKMMAHCMNVGYSPDTFVPDGNRPNTQQTLSFDNGHVVFDRHCTMPISLIRENIELEARLEERFRLPVEALKTSEQEFSIESVVVNPVHAYSIRQQS